jgi:hypothetical protein
VHENPRQSVSSPHVDQEHTTRSRFGSIGTLPTVRIGAVVGLAFIAGVVAWLVLRGDETSIHEKRAPAHAVSTRELAVLPSEVHHPVYWAGPRSAITYELTQTTDGRIFIRYLPAGVAVGTNDPKYLTIGTYPVKNAQAAVRAIAKRVGVTPVALTGGGVAVQDAKHPTSVYLAYPRSAYQVEVFDPSPTRARSLVVSGQITPILSNPAAVQHSRPAAAVKIADLRALAATIGNPVYWAGRQAGATYERTQTSDGRIYVRYLPPGVRAGDPDPHTTVGTYPFQDATGAVTAIAKRTGARIFKVAGGAVAVVDPGHPTSVYLAFPGSNFEIEVFDPSPARARQLVTSGRITSIR